MSQKKRRIGVVMDPIESIKPPKDSTLAMLLEAQARGWEVHYMGRSVGPGRPLAGPHEISRRP